MKLNNIFPLVCLVVVTGLMSGLLGPRAFAEDDKPTELKGSCFFNSTRTRKNVHLSYTPSSSFLGLSFSPLGQGTLTVDGEVYSVAEVDVRTPGQPAGLAKDHHEATSENELENFKTLWPDRINSHVVRVFLGNIVRDIENKRVTVGSFILEDRLEVPIPEGKVVLRKLTNYDNLTAAGMAFLDDEFPGCALTQFDY